MTCHERTAFLQGSHCFDWRDDDGTPLVFSVVVVGVAAVVVVVVAMHAAVDVWVMGVAGL